MGEIFENFSRGLEGVEECGGREWGGFAEVLEVGGGFEAVDGEGAL